MQYVIKEGTINKTKIMSENGKKFRKNWTTSYAVLTELFLLFFKDAKTFAAMKMDQSATAKPDISVDLNGASIESADRLSNRKNVYLISTLLGLQVLIQCDSFTGTAEWYQEIHKAIQKLVRKVEFLEFPQNDSNRYVLFSAIQSRVQKVRAAQRVNSGICFYTQEIF